MTERVIVQADEDSLPEITDIATLKMSYGTAESDDFKKTHEEIKSLNGIDTNFKRRMANKFAKARKSVDGETGSKQINEETFFTGYDAFDVIEPAYNLDYLAKLYEVSSPHYSAVNAKVYNIAGLGYRLVENSSSKRNFEAISNDKKKTKNMRAKLDLHRDQTIEKIEDFNEDDTFTETIIKVWRDYEVTGNGYIEVGRKKDGTIGYVGHIPSQTMRIRRQRDGFVQMSGSKVQFFANFGAGINSKTNKPVNLQSPISGDSDKPNEVIHIKKYSPTSGYYGVPDIVAAMSAVAGNKAAEQFNLDFFENKAIPKYVIILKGAKLGQVAETKLMTFFETRLKRNDHRTVIIPLPPSDKDNPIDISFEKIEPDVQDSSFTNYRRANVSDILMAHRVPITKISVAEGTSLAMARDADKTFKEQVCEPEQRVFEKKLNRIIKELSDALEIKLNEMSLTDEDTQSKIDERRRKTGVETANEQRIRRGEAAIEGGDVLFDLNATGPAARAEERTSRERDAQRSAGATDSAGEGRATQGEGRATP